MLEYSRTARRGVGRVNPKWKELQSSNVCPECFHHLVHTAHDRISAQASELPGENRSVEPSSRVAFCVRIGRLLTDAWSG